MVALLDMKITSVYPFRVYGLGWMRKFRLSIESHSSVCIGAGGVLCPVEEVFTQSMSVTYAVEGCRRSSKAAWRGHFI